ncbi:hypothetical protein QUF84_14700 [Fictibacillus enclensis]|uniref:hypothetical protein n=1 Tax=Fictibacillus enclensis TaxID=1017270 RepID=UPI0025A27BC9|nr:hypothetical protein [Fictibacillus enclensis]MDM5338464.1 hypothetical protein [Fictibacillus enclensis]
MGNGKGFINLAFPLGSGNKPFVITAFFSLYVYRLAEEMVNEQKAVEDERLLDRELGQLQLLILKGLLEEEANTISNQATQTSAESQFL